MKLNAMFMSLPDSRARYANEYDEHDLAASECRVAIFAECQDLYQSQKTPADQDEGPVASRHVEQRRLGMQVPPQQQRADQ
jgi:hypothetical protein